MNEWIELFVKIQSDFKDLKIYNKNKFNDEIIINIELNWIEKMKLS